MPEHCSIGVLGHRGFVGSHVVRELVRRRCETICLPRISPDVASEELLRSLRDCKVVVNCAGLAAATHSGDDLIAKNVRLPITLLRACEVAGVKRLVHVSSAAVQGRRPVLDESLEYAPFSEYSRSKAEAEQALLKLAQVSPVELTIYRPTSVQGSDRQMTRTLVKLAGLPFPIVGSGQEHIPLATIDNVARCIGALATCEASIAVALHPWEGVTQRSFFEIFGGRTPWASGDPAKRVLASILRSPGVPNRLQPYIRRLELVFSDQRQHSRSVEFARKEFVNSDECLRRMVSSIG